MGKWGLEGAGVKELRRTMEPSCFILMRCAWIALPAAPSVNENAPGRLGALLPTAAPPLPPASFPISPRYGFKFSNLETSDGIRHIPFQECIVLSEFVANCRQTASEKERNQAAAAAATDS